MYPIVSKAQYSTVMYAVFVDVFSKSVRIQSFVQSYINNFGVKIVLIILAFFPSK